MSDKARAIWEPRISSVSQMFQKLEIDAVSAGIKPITMQSCAPHEFVKLFKQCTEKGIFVVPLAQEGHRNFYSNAAAEFDPNKPWEYRVAIGSDKTILNFSRAWSARDDVAIGGMLGFPACCRAFFKKYWVDQGYRDLTYPMVINEANANDHYNVSGPTSCNILLRWLGIRRVSHLPCSFHCDSTKVLGGRLNDLAMNLYRQEANWLGDLLEFPVRYTSLHGVATITTPIFRIVTSTDPYAEKITIDRDGRVYPDESAIGLEFPFSKRSPMKFVKSSSLWTDSGFDSGKAMDQAHNVIIQLLQHARITDINNVIDLGSGSGALLKKIGSYLPVQLYGIEVDRGRFDRAVKRLTGSSIIIFNMNLVDYSWAAPHGLVLMSLNRLLEMGELRGQYLKKIAEKSKYLILYSYDKTELDVSWSEYFKFIHAERSDQTIAYLLRSLNADQEDEAIGLPQN